MDTVVTRNYLNVRQAADFIGISKSSLDKQRLSGKGPRYLRVGSRILYRRDDIDAWLSRFEQSSTAENQRAPITSDRRTEQS